MLISRTSWKCEVIDSTLSCPEQAIEPSSMIQNTKFIPADYLRENETIRYTLSLETANEASETGFDVLTDCSITL